MHLSVSNVESVWMIMIHTMNYVRSLFRNIICLFMLKGCKVRIFFFKKKNSVHLKGWKVSPFQGLRHATSPIHAQ